MRATAALLLALLTLGATPQGMAPLPAQYVKGRTFSSPDGWFKVDAPAARWEWFEMRKFDGDADPRWPDSVHQMVGWMVRDPENGDAFTVLESYNPFAKMMDDVFFRELEPQTRKGATPDEKISDFHAEWIGVPEEKSIRYWYKVEKKSGQTVYRFAYITGWQHKVFLQAFSDKPEEPRIFTRMVVSMRWLKQP